MNIEQALKAADAANIVHFPQGISVVRDGSGFVAKIVDGNGPTGVAWRGESADDAIQALLAGIKEEARKYAVRTRERAIRDAEAVEEIIGVQQ